MSALLGEFQSANWTPNGSGCLQYFFGGISRDFLFPIVGLWGGVPFPLAGWFFGCPPGGPPGGSLGFFAAPWPSQNFWIFHLEYSLSPSLNHSLLWLQGDVCMKKRANAMDGGWIYRSREKQNQKKLQKNSGHTLSADDRWVIIEKRQQFISDVDV